MTVITNPSLPTASKSRDVAEAVLTQRTTVALQKIVDAIQAATAQGLMKTRVTVPATDTSDKDFLVEALTNAGYRVDPKPYNYTDKTYNFDIFW